MGNDQLAREMTLREWVGRLPPHHRAQEEYQDLLDAEARLDVYHAAKGRLLRDALLRICEAWAREGWEKGPTVDEAINGTWDVLHNLEIAVPGCECADCEGRR